MPNEGARTWAEKKLEIGELNVIGVARKTMSVL
jgi:hypothetical protein